jgi:hypothetical protein
MYVLLSFRAGNVGLVIGDDVAALEIDEGVDTSGAGTEGATCSVEVLSNDKSTTGTIEALSKRSVATEAVTY